MRNARGGGDVLQPETLGSCGCEPRLSRLQYQAARFLGRPAKPLAALDFVY